MEGVQKGLADLYAQIMGFTVHSLFFPFTLTFDIIFNYRNFGDNAFPVINTITAEKLHKLQQDLRRKVMSMYALTGS